jgi:dTDP-glucose 4,6-dehydratase
MAESEGSAGEVINIGNGAGISIGDLAEHILGLLKVDKPIRAARERIRPENSEVMKLICNNQKAADILGWQPAVSLQEGLQETIAYFRDHIGRYKAGVYNI